MIIQSKFKPISGLSHHHIQTLLPTLLRQQTNISFQQQTLELPDGDFVDLAWKSMPGAGDNQPIVVVFHGLEGSIHSPYVKGILASLHQRGWHAVLMHFRNCSGRINRLPRAYHSGDTGDAGYFLDYLKQQYPQSALAAVGYSLGGNMLLKLQAELGSTSPLQAAVSVCAPLKLDVCADRIRRGFSRIYQAHLMRRLKQNLINKYTQHDYQDLIGLKKEQVHQLKDFWQFDDAFTAPMHGFKNVHDYYTRSSARQYLGEIQSPTLLIQTLDDPFMTPDVLPGEKEVSKAVQLEYSTKGGHVGFVSGQRFKPFFWLEKRIPDFLSEYIDR